SPAHWDPARESFGIVWRLSPTRSAIPTLPLPTSGPAASLVRWLRVVGKRAMQAPNRSAWLCKAPRNRSETRDSTAAKLQPPLATDRYSSRTAPATWRRQTSDADLLRERLRSSGQELLPCNVPSGPSQFLVAPELRA